MPINNPGIQLLLQKEITNLILKILKSINTLSKGIAQSEINLNKIKREKKNSFIKAV
jgi:hypothetical protein